jgi:hypothetical protein
MGRFDTRTVKIQVAVPGFDLDRATKVFLERKARNALRLKQATQASRAGVSSNQPSPPLPSPKPVVLGQPQTTQVAQVPPQDDGFHMEL